jgi:hypothetical protein
MPASRSIYKDFRTGVPHHEGGGLAESEGRLITQAEWERVAQSIDSLAEDGYVQWKVSVFKRSSLKAGQSISVEARPN